MAGFFHGQKELRRVFILLVSGVTTGHKKNMWSAQFTSQQFKGHIYAQIALNAPKKTIEKEENEEEEPASPADK